MGTAGTLILVGFCWFTMFKIWGQVILYRAGNPPGLRNLFPPHSIIGLFDQWDALRFPTLAAIPGLVMFVWGIVLLF